MADMLSQAACDCLLNSSANNADGTNPMRFKLLSKMRTPPC